MAKKVSIEITLDKQTKDEIVEAAEVCGMDLSTFMIAATRPYVERAERDGQSIHVSEEDRDRLRSALQRPPRNIFSEQNIEKANVIPVIKTIYNIFDAWGLSDVEQVGILGLTDITYKEFRDPELIRADEGLMIRCSYILGIYKSLQVLLPDAEAADSWINRKNTAKLFDGKSPRELLATGNIKNLRLVHQFVTSASHGNW